MPIQTGKWKFCYASKDFNNLDIETNSFPDKFKTLFKNWPITKYNSNLPYFTW